MFHPQLIDHVKPALWHLSPDVLRRDARELCAIAAAGVAFMTHSSGFNSYEAQWWDKIVFSSRYFGRRV